MRQIVTFAFFAVGLLFQTKVFGQKDPFLGKWDCKAAIFPVYIVIDKDGGKYKSTITFKKDNSTKRESLVKTGDKLSVKGSKTGEYYIINKFGELESWDKDGLFVVARRPTAADQQTKKTATFDKNACLGRNIFDVRNEFSKSNPETLTGTNNQYWIVYYADLNCTFKVQKSADKILKVTEGRVPNFN